MKHNTYKNLMKRFHELPFANPPYIFKLESELTLIQIKIYKSMCMKGTGLFTNKQIARMSRISQWSNASVQINRMVRKGFIEKIKKNQYQLKDKEMSAYLYFRWRPALFPRIAKKYNIKKIPELENDNNK